VRAEALIVTKLEPTNTGMGGAVMTGLAVRFTGPPQKREN
jgi:hypothetical protein